MTAELDDLRRRLYAPDVTPEELERYRALQEATQEPPEQPPAAAIPASPSRRRRRAPIVVGVAAAAAMAVATVALATAPPPKPFVPPTPTPAPSVVALDQTSLALPASARAALVTQLKSGRSAGLLAYLYAHPADLPLQVRTVTRAESEEHFGAGPGMVGITPSTAAQHGGRLTIAVTVDRATTVDLQLVRADSGMQSFIERLDGGAPATPGQPIVRTVVYDGEAPTVLEITLPKGVHWDVVTVLTD